MRKRHNYPKATILIIPGLLLWCRVVVAAQMPTDPDAARAAAYTCAPSPDTASSKRLATDLGTHTSDKNALACSADFWFQVAQAQPDEREPQVGALRAIVRYMHYVRQLKDFDLIQISWPEHALRLQHAARLAAELANNARIKWPTDAALQVLGAEIAIALGGPSDAKAVAHNVEIMKAAVARDPAVLSGEGEIAIGRGLLDLPPLFGGGATKAIHYLEHARQLAPDDPRPIRYLVEAYDEVGRDADARAALRDLATVSPRDFDLQMFADEWRMGEGLAARFNDTRMVRRFAELRAGLMHEHPELLLRKVSSTFGHGGDDPVSGRPQYLGEQSTPH